MEKWRGTFVTMSHFVVPETYVSIIIAAVLKYTYMLVLELILFAF
jgi:hypothetical protein